MLYYSQVGHQAEQGHVPRRRAGGSLRQFLCEGLELSVLSIHIDESGNFSLSNRQNPEYCLAMVFHNQNDDISQEIAFLDNKLSEIGCEAAFIHTTPLIRQDKPFENLLRDERKRIFSTFASFVSNIPVSYTAFTVQKFFYQNSLEIEAAFEREIKGFINEKLEYFQSFDEIVIYYDRGQAIVTSILQNTFGSVFGDRVKFRTAYQKDYKLLQVADYICTLEQSKARWDVNKPTKSEKDFFYTRQMFMKNFYNKIRRKHI